MRRFTENLFKKAMTCFKDHCNELSTALHPRSVGMMIWGWVEWSKTEEVPCVGNDDINPRTLALALWLKRSTRIEVKDTLTMIG